MGVVHTLCRTMNIVLDFIKSLTVEPIAFLVFLSFNMFMVAHHAGLYQAICIQTFPANVNYVVENPSVVEKNVNGTGRFRQIGNGTEGRRFGHSGDGGEGGGHKGHGGHRSGGGEGASNINHNRSGGSMYSSTANQDVVNCDHLENNPDAENTVQERMATFNLLESVTHVIPTLVAHVLFGALGDKYGRKLNILIGITGALIHTLPFIILMEYNSTPLWVLILVSCLTSFTGTMGTVMMSSFAYLADTIIKKENLTVRMTIYAVVTSASGVVGSALAVPVIEYLKISYIGVIQITSVTLAFFYALIRLKQLPPGAMKKRMREKEAKKMANGNCDPTELELAEQQAPHKKQKLINLFPAKQQYPNVKLTKWQRIKSITRETWGMLVEVYRTYTKPRPHRHRIYLLLVVVIFFFDLLSNMALHMNSIYVFRSPISWKATQLAKWKMTGNALHFCANLMGIILFKKLLKLRETTIMLIALTSHMAQEIIMGFANASWMLYLSTCVGSLSPLFMPCVKSFVTQIVDADEVGKSFIMFGLAMDIGRAISGVGSNAIYRATVRFFPGFIYLFCSGFLGVSIIVLLYVHIDSIRQDSVKLAEKNETS